MTESFTVTTVDGTSEVVTVTITGTNDAAVISGTSSASVSETNAAITATGTLSATDVDSSSAFVAQTAVAGTNGTFSIGTTGEWTYTANSAFNELNVGTSVTESFTVTTVDGTSEVVTVTITGTNDAAVINGQSSAFLTETNAAQSATGQLTSTDVDGTANLFISQSGVARTYGTFSITTDGAWNYTMNGAHDEFVAGQTYTDSFTVEAADHTSKVVTVTLTGVNDAAVISGTSSASLTESDVVLSATGTLTSTDIDGTANLFTAQSGVSRTYGMFSIGTNGVWTYTANSEHNEFIAGQSYTDSIMVATADGTTQLVTVTITGTNDAAVIDGISTGYLTETNAIQSVTGLLNSADVDGTDNLFISQSGVARTYGTFSIGTDGAWSYAMGSAHNEFVSGQTYTDSFTVETADHTSTVVTVIISGSNDNASIAGTSTGSVTEDVSVTPQNTLVASGLLTVSDPDTGESVFTARPSVSGLYGTFTLTSDGNWTYTALNANTTIQALAYGASLVDSFTAVSGDGTASQVVTVTINGTYDPAYTQGVDTSLVSETNSPITTGGTMNPVIVDGSSAFIARNGVTGTYGTFSINTNGEWTYTASNAHNEFIAGQNYTDSFSVLTTASTAAVVMVTIEGTNDAAVITGDFSSSVAETDAAITTDGTLTVNDVDNSNDVIVPSEPLFSAYGTFSITAQGVWSYTANDAFDYLGAGSSLVDSFSIGTVDGTSAVVTITITGTNDTATIGGTSTGTVTEDVSVTGGMLNASGSLTLNDPDSGQSLFRIPENTGTYGVFTLSNSGAWTYSVNNSSVQSLGASSTLTDSFTAVSSDGTASKVVTVTIQGRNDAAILPAPTVSRDETDLPLVISESITINDPDTGESTFVTQSDTAGSHGKFSITEAGVWTYTANSAFNELNSGESYTDIFTVTSADHTTTTVTIIINGTDESGLVDVTAALTQAGEALSTSGQLGGGGTFITMTQQSGSYGTFSVDMNGAWSYDMNSAHREFVDGSIYCESFIVTTTLNASSTVTINITGINDAPEITGEIEVNVHETDSTITKTGLLYVNDYDGTAVFGEQTDVAGVNGYGIFSIATDGHWTFTTNDANNLLNIGDVVYDYLLLSAVDNLDLAATDVWLKVAIHGTYESIVDTYNVNSLTGTDNADALNGGWGNDSLTGGLGNDAFVFDTPPDIVNNVDTITDFNPADDKLYLSLSVYATLTLGELSADAFYIGSAAQELSHRIIYDDTTGDLFYDADGSDSGAAEKIATLTGAPLIDNTNFMAYGLVVGDSSDNTFTGTNFDDTISGGPGNDTLTGGLGSDVFIFDATPDPINNVDTITDFTHWEDKINLSGFVFDALTSSGELSAAEFYTGSAAHDSDDRIIYDVTAGDLFYDADGNGSGDAVKIAYLSGLPTIDNTDFIVI
ncbi:beta strand repeat-containing protein [Candidatus Chlorobium masyuteum]|uniref:beta strand repeat-containing protein n=1 Tax=Candidatus Chlorobium masyuteum TaxID=2716876 RepID=UPI0038B26FF7